MLNESKAMKEIREIRDINYEFTKNMSNEEYIKFVNDRANKAKQKMEELRKAKV